MEKTVPCKHCGGEAQFEKEWKMKGRVQGKRQIEFHPTKRNVVLVRLFRCVNCGKTMRKAIPQKEE